MLYSDLSSETLLAHSYMLQLFTGRHFLRSQSHADKKIIVYWRIFLVIAIINSSFYLAVIEQQLKLLTQAAWRKKNKSQHPGVLETEFKIRHWATELRTAFFQQVLLRC